MQFVTRWFEWMGADVFHRKMNIAERNCFCIWVLPQLSDTHFSQVLNKLEKNFFHGFIKYHLLLHLNYTSFPLPKQ